MASFELAYKHIDMYEGGYVDHPDDRGGETYRGVARNLFPQWNGWAIIDKAKKKPGFPQSLDTDVELGKNVKMFFKRNFWDKFSGDMVQSQIVADELLDIAVNMGVKRAVYFVQRVLNAANKNNRLWRDVAVDGIFGMKTLNALNAAIKKNNYAVLVAKALNALQGSRYITLTERDATQKVFFEGWFNRINFVGDD